MWHTFVHKTAFYLPLYIEAYNNLASKQNSCRKIHNQSFHSCSLMHAEKIQLLFNTTGMFWAISLIFHEKERKRAFWF